MRELPSSLSLSPAALAHLQSWQGRNETLHDRAALQPLAALAATLGCDNPARAEGDAVPPLWHWLYFLALARRGEIGPDGLPERGGFLPPVPLPRRMWAGARLAWEAGNPMRAGQQLTRESSIDSVVHKSGRSGELLFVQVAHRYANDGGLALTEEQDIVYRPMPAPGAPAPAPQKPPLAGQAAWSRSVQPDPVLLFRYSALTFNGHRIHYDRSYATQVEGYPGLLVHGPLLATLLIELLRSEMPGAQLLSFDFRAVRPTFDLHTFTINGRPSADGRAVELWTEDHEGWLTLQATATVA